VIRVLDGRVKADECVEDRVMSADELVALNAEEAAVE